VSALPALLGGAPLFPAGPPPWPVADAALTAVVQAALADHSWGVYHGPHTEALTADLAAWLQVPQVQLCASGTLAVEAALRAVGVGPGDEVIVAGYDYPANFLCVHAVGALPVVVEVAATNWNLDPEPLAHAQSERTKAVLVAHLHGGLVPMPAVRDFARVRGVAVIEDAAQCPGARVAGRWAGTWGDLGILSFGGSKLLSAGRGGALVAADARLAQRARLWLSRGPQQWAALSELQALVLRSQLPLLADRNAQRAAAVQQLQAALAEVPGLRLFAVGTDEPAYYKVGWQFTAAEFGLSRTQFVQALRAEGVAFDAGFPAVHLGRARNRLRQVGPLPHATAAHAGTVILHHPILLAERESVGRVADAVWRTYTNRTALAARLGEAEP
jgi:dTDP-4-amino-4,6-dideoxygalactose transaminase